MQNFIAQDAVNWPEIRLSRLEQSLIAQASARNSEHKRAWISDALQHYALWQDMWDGTLNSEGDVSAEVDLFATLVQNAPASLRGHWRLVHELVRLNASMWCWPTTPLDELEMGIAPTMPTLDRRALAAAWPGLRAVARGFVPRQENASDVVSR